MKIVFVTRFVNIAMPTHHHAYHINTALKFKFIIFQKSNMSPIKCTMLKLALSDHLTFIDEGDIKGDIPRLLGI